MDFISILELFGGVGLFLFGMSLMGSSLEQLAGSGLEQILATMTTSKNKALGAVKGWAFGTGVTGIIQSSAATTIMLIGFVNAGIMTLAQAIPVVLGANVGSTVTAQILRLGDLGGGSIILQIFKPSGFAPILVAVGAFIYIFIKKKRQKQIAGILLGLGTLFYGMVMMEEVFLPLRESVAFQRLFTSFQNPLLGILIGLVITAIIQSSSASVGILQALSATGAVTYSTAVPIIIGQNIGKCMTILLGSIGAKKKAKRVALSYLLFNTLAAVFFTAVIYIIYYTVGIPWFSKQVNRGQIANLHLLFNLIPSILLLPLSEKLSALTGKILHDTDEEDGDSEFRKLDAMLLHTPSVALRACKELILTMSERIRENFGLAMQLITDYDESLFARLEDNEAFIDRCETVLSSYIIRIDRRRLTRDNERIVTEILESIGDFERLGDYCINIAYVAREKQEAGVTFSPSGEQEVLDLAGATEYTLDTVLRAFATDDRTLATRVEPVAEVIDQMKEVVKSHHIERLQKGICSIQGGVTLFDLINAFERIAAHSTNVALHVVKRVDGDAEFDEMHGHAYDPQSEEFQALYQYYAAKYLDSVTQRGAVLTEEAQEERRVEKLKKDAEKAEKQKKDKKEKKEKAEKEKAEKQEEKKKQDEKKKQEEKKKQDEKKKKDAQAEKADKKKKQKA